MERLTNNELDALEAALAKYGDHTPLDIKFRLPALIAAARTTVPEVIGEKHRDGNWWLVWEPGAEGWFKCRWRPVGDWQKSATTERLLGTPTHALPLPPAPEGKP